VHRFGLLCAFVATTACSSGGGEVSPTPAPVPNPAPGTSNESNTQVTRLGLQFSGDMAYIAEQRVDISAPILPRTDVIYRPFPATLAGEAEMAHQAALLFPWLLAQCAPLYPQIKLGSGQTAKELATNYEQVATCAYEKFSAKPYWIPQLVADVDICRNELGENWRLISEQDLALMTDADFQYFTDTLSGSDGFGSEFFSLVIWVRANDGTIKFGNLSPAVSNRVGPLVYNGGGPKDHYEGSLALRCIRRSAP